jgi:hypothetical protein
MSLNNAGGKSFSYMTQHSRVSTYKRNISSLMTLFKEVPYKTSTYRSQSLNSFMRRAPFLSLQRSADNKYVFFFKVSPILSVTSFCTELHCINNKSYIAQKSVSISSGPDSIVMHSFIARYCFCQSSKMMMNTFLFNSIWHAKAIYSRERHRS